MEYSKYCLQNVAIFFVLFVHVLYLYMSFPLISYPFSAFRHAYSLNPTTLMFPIDELERVLHEASMPNKTIIIAIVNKAYVEQSIDSNTTTTMLDLFLESYWVGENTMPLLDHLLLVAVDQTAYERCKFRRLHCYRLVTDGVDFGGEKVYMSEDFIKMMWRRTSFLLQVLKRGYNFIFTDTDVMWLRNPFLRLSKDKSEDLQISVDRFNGDIRSEKNPINTGFYYIKSSHKTISLFNTWYSMKEHSRGIKEQDVLTRLMRRGLFRQLGIKAGFLETKQFSGFCQDSQEFETVTTVHANCCKHIDAKLIDLSIVLSDWRRFKASNHSVTAQNGIKSFQWSAHNKCLKSWNHD